MWLLDRGRLKKVNSPALLAVSLYCGHYSASSDWMASRHHLILLRWFQTFFYIMGRLLKSFTGAVNNYPETTALKPHCKSNSKMKRKNVIFFFKYIIWGVFLKPCWAEGLSCQDDWQPCKNHVHIQFHYCRRLAVTAPVRVSQCTVSAALTDTLQYWLAFTVLYCMMQYAGDCGWQSCKCILI